MSRWRRSRACSLVAALLVAVPLYLADRPAAFAALGDCSQPVTNGARPAASDCLFILQVAVSVAVCLLPICICNPNGVGGSTASDALICLKHAVGQDVALACPCGITTTTQPLAGGCCDCTPGGCASGAVVQPEQCEQICAPASGTFVPNAACNLDSGSCESLPTTTTERTDQPPTTARVTTTTTTTTTTTVGDAPCTLDETGDAPVCAGDCPEGLDCLIESGLVICTCTRPCQLDEAFGCGGGCESPDQACQLTAGDTCDCVSTTESCRDLSADLGLVTGVCGGLCPNPADECRYDGTKPEGPCLCLGRERPPGDEPTPPCRLDESQDPAVCGGFCPTPGQVCQGDPDGGECACVTPASPCGFVDGDEGPVCGGTCPEPQACVLVEGSVVGEDECRCADPNEAGASDPVRACGRSPSGGCLGDCSDPRVECRADPSTNTCACIPEPPNDDPLSPCAEGPDETCAGFCPEPGQVCDPAAEGGCACTTPVFACGLLDRPDGPVCAGDCPDDTACIMSPFDGTCFCGEACAGNEIVESWIDHMTQVKARIDPKCLQ